MIDVHAHLVDHIIHRDLETLLEAASKSGVSDIIGVSEDLNDCNTVISLPKAMANVRIHRALGLHPEKASLDALPQMIEIIHHHASTLSCIGEIGLDYSPHVLGTERPEEVKAIQQQCMKAQLEVAKELGLAVNVHSRSAGHHTIALLQECGVKKAVLHAFDGKAHYAEMAATSGYYLSVPPCAIRSPLMTKWIKRIPLQSLLLETDCPALAPEKGETNHPCNLLVSCQVIANIKGISVEEVREVTTANAKTLFHLEAWDNITEEQR